MPKLVHLSALLATAALAALAFQKSVLAQGYDYPFVNAYEATVIGTPSIYRAELPKQVPKQELGLTVFPKRRIPELFWYHDQLHYAVVRQRQKAPLIFNIAGTGASHNSQLMQAMEKIFYKAGFHVISLPSPTHPNFIVTASETQAPGLLADDARDLYRVMQGAYEQIAHTIEVSEFYLTGYSLGAAQAAFVAKLDEEVGAFDFKKVLMINPPVSLYNSVEILDGMIDAIPGGPDNFNAFFESLFQRFAAIYRDEDFLDLTDDFLYFAYKKDPPSEESLRAVVGIAFRISAANILFASDALTRSGVVIRRNVSLSTLDSLTRYLKVSVRVGFVDYIRYLLHPFFEKRRPGVRLEELIEESSLQAIEGYLRGTEKIGLMTNEDDIILAPGELDYLRSVFGSRARIYVKGGHCGNLEHKDNVADMIRFFGAGWPAP
ncbi:MAG: alpha/beta fold hydrolase [Rhodospirillales bacterium]|nr:alpha/beta fold hydrolase [Rhodospirillales bacterium]